MATPSETRTSRVHVAWLIPAMAAGVALVIALTISLMEGEVQSEIGAAPEQGAEPAGAGTAPDGVADETEEGLENETSSDDFVDSSAGSEADGTAPDEGDGGEPATDASEVEPAAGDADPAERMTGDGAEGEDAGDGEAAAAGEEGAAGTEGETAGDDAPAGDDAAAAEGDTASEGETTDTEATDTETADGAAADTEATGGDAAETETETPPVARIVPNDEAAGDTDLVEDPDGGQEGEPDGGADPFVTTPSGPEGRDDDPATPE